MAVEALTTKDYEPIPLTQQGSDRVIAYACGKCHQVVSLKLNTLGILPEAYARNHCAEVYYKCSGCGKESKYRMSSCSSCRQKEQFESAEKLSIKDWQDEYIYDSMSDQYFSSLDEFFDYYHDTSSDERPRHVNTTKQIKWKGIDVSRLYESEFESFSTDGYYEEEHLVDAKGLEQFLKDWSAKQDISVYESNPDKVVLITEEDYLRAYL